EAEHHGAVGILDLRQSLAEFYLRIGRLARLGEVPLDAHRRRVPLSIYSAFCGGFPVFRTARRRSAVRRMRQGPSDPPFLPAPAPRPSGGSPPFGSGRGPGRSLETENFARRHVEADLHYLVSNLAANTKYSVNR